MKITKDKIWPDGMAVILKYPEAKRIFVKTSRSAGKTTTWARVFPLELMALNNSRNIAVLGKTTSWHIHNTMNEFEKNMTSFEKDFAIKGYADLFHISRDKTAPRIYYKPNNQMFAFLGTNSPDNAKGISPKVGYFDTIIYEECISIDENNDIEQTMDNYKSIKISLFKKLTR